MPSSTRTVFICRQCDRRSGKWFGRCPGCGAWDSLRQARPEAAAPALSAVRPIPYPELPPTDSSRTSTGIGELDRVLGGGLVPGAVVLIGGEPGIGKSTLLLQAASAMAEAGADVLYATGEESAAQLRLRGDRLGVRSQRLKVLAETSADAIRATAENERPTLLIVDSVQAVRCDDVPSVAGSTSQVREAAHRFVELAKRLQLPTLLVGHVTKDGALAGPRALEHVVDGVVHFEGDRHLQHRILRTLKNRFGPTDEIGVFVMDEDGLTEVGSASEIFLTERADPVAGSAVLAAIEGSRPLVVEVQALIGEADSQAPPRRRALGVDGGRLSLILAVLHRHAALDLGGRDVFVNVVGGLTISEPAADLAVAAAVVSSAWRRPLPGDTVVAGEIGLTGELRPVGALEQRFKEAARMGFRRGLVPSRSPAAASLDRLEADDLAQALGRLWPPDRGQIG